jgi:hypothetical protein
MPRRTLFILAAFCLASLPAPLWAQGQTVDRRPSEPVAGKSDRERDGLLGPVRQVRTETALFVRVAGESIEGARELLSTVAYGEKGERVSGDLSGGQTILPSAANYKPGGVRIREESVRATDGSVVLQKLYTYETDEVGNWIKMVLSVAQGEGGGARIYLPLQVTYRTITYYHPASTQSAGTPNPQPADGPAQEKGRARQGTAGAPSTVMELAPVGARAAPSAALPLSGAAAADGETTTSSAATRAEEVPPARAAPSPLLPLENGDILRMVEAKLPVKEIVAKIKSSPCRFDIFPPVIGELRYRGVPEPVLAAMIEVTRTPFSPE